LHICTRYNEDVAKNFETTDWPYMCAGTKVVIQKFWSREEITMDAFDIELLFEGNVSMEVRTDMCL